MNSFDDIFDSAASRNNRNDQPLDKEAWGKQKQAERQAVYELADTTAAVVASDGGKFRDYLDVQSRFGRYTATNALLILAQMPQTTKVKDFDGWKDSGASIKKHQKGFSILAPGAEYVRPDGSRGTGYDVKKVFDISQTTARSQAQPAANMDDRTLLKALIHKPPVPIQTVDTLQGNLGAVYDHSQGVIFVRKGMSAPDIFRSVSMALAHAELAGKTENYTYQGSALAAYSVSYMLCRQYGVDVGGYDFSRAPDSFRDADPQSIRASLGQIQETAKDISMRMSRTLEQNKAPKTKGQER